MAFAFRDLGINLSPEMAGGFAGPGGPGGPGVPGGPQIAPYPTWWWWCCGWFTRWCGWISCRWYTHWCRWYTFCGFRTPCGWTWFAERPEQPRPEEMLEQIREALREELASIERMQELGRAANDPAKQAELMRKFLKEEEEKLRQIGEGGPGTKKG